MVAHAEGYTENPGRIIVTKLAYDAEQTLEKTYHDIPQKSSRADFTFGSRFANGADPRTGGMSLYRYVGNKLTTRIENWALGPEIYIGVAAVARDEAPAPTGAPSSRRGGLLGW